MERVDRLAGIRAERQMELPAGRVLARQREVVEPRRAEGHLALLLAPRSHLGEPERLESRAVEGAAALEVAHADGQMVDHHAPLSHGPAGYPARRVNEAWQRSATSRYRRAACGGPRRWAGSSAARPRVAMRRRRRTSPAPRMAAAQ